GSPAGLQLHQYATGRYTVDVAGGTVCVSVNTTYPDNGTIAVTVEETAPPAGPGRPWTLSLRVPQWCRTFSVSVAGRRLEHATVQDGWLRLERDWAPGDEVVLDLHLDVRRTAADPRADAVRGCVAIERGPLVYCVEQTDQDGGGLDDIVLAPDAAPRESYEPGLLGGVTTVTVSGYRRILPATGWWPYRDAGGQASADAAPPPGQELELTCIPYYAWANREDGSMRVWLPTH
ncbi:glycoside hydrolase family 127 protein, partial [Streptomyces sp. PRB2-1]|nr:glycoside hydrolase family 127 protein [Actinacidiphila epipremni]